VLRTTDKGDDWSTPEWLFEQLEDEFRFTLDAAASAANAKCINYFTKEDDALRHSWAGHTVWLNGPWDPDTLERFVEKAYDESRGDTTVVLLLPYWKGYSWFNDYCVKHGQIRHIAGKVYFRGANGRTLGHDCVVVVFGPGFRGYTNGPTIKRPGSDSEETETVGRISPGRWYEIDGEFKKYSPVQVMRPAGEAGDRWQVETEYEIRLTVPTTVIQAEIPDDAVGSETSENGRTTSQPRKSYTLLSDVLAQPVEYLWGDRIPFGEITVISGDPGTNKSSLTLDLAARVTTGRAMPDGTPGIQGGVLLIQAEDSVDKTLKARAIAAGAEVGRIAVIEDATIPSSLSMIEKTVADVGARLVVIDPLFCYVDGNAHNEQAVRRALKPLRQLAERNKLSVILIRHLVKTNGKKPLYSGSGSIGITAAVRSEFLVGISPDDNDCRVLAHVKSNLAPRAASMLFAPFDDHGTVRIEWRGECEYSADDLLAKPKDTRPMRDSANAFLLAILAKGPVQVEELQGPAAAAGIKWRTLERAKRDLGVRVYRRGKGRRRPWVWELPEVRTKNE